MTLTTSVRSLRQEEAHGNFVNLTINPEGIGSKDVSGESTEQSKERPGRGRRPTGKALSAAERQARRLAKLDAEGKAVLPPAVVSLEVKQALAKFIQFKDMTLGDALDRIVRDRLLRKRSGRHKSRAKRPPTSPTIEQN